MALELTPEQKTKINEAFALLPIGFEIISTEQIDILRAQKRESEAVIKTLIPIFQALPKNDGTTEPGNIMAVLPTLIPKIMPLFTTLQNDVEFNKNLNAVIERLK